MPAQLALSKLSLTLSGLNRLFDRSCFFFSISPFPMIYLKVMPIYLTRVHLLMIRNIYFSTATEH